MATENPEGDGDIPPIQDDESDLPPTPFPDSVVYVWFSLLEAAIAATLAVFSIGLLEGGDIIPSLFPHLTMGIAIFVAVLAVLLAIRLRK